MSSLQVKQTPSEERKNPPSSRPPRKGRVDGGSNSIRQRFGRFSHNDAVGRFTGSTILWVCYPKPWRAPMNGKRESLHHGKSGEVQVCEPCAKCGSFSGAGSTDREFQGPDHNETVREKFLNPISQARRTQVRNRATDCISQVSRHWETGRTRFQSGFNLSKKASLVNPRLTQCRGGPTST